MTDGRKIFIDCGANRGQSIPRFRSLYEDHEQFEIYCFEPQEEVASRIDLSPNLGAVSCRAVWTYDGEIEFYPGPSTLGSTLFGDKTTGNIASEPVKAHALDLSRFVSENFLCSDFVVLKLNIEGAEYAVLEKMLAEGTIAIVDHLYVRWHQVKVPSISKERHAALVAAIEAAGLECRDFWT